ncbi:MATH domain and coiled-coil domain-containing protein At2g01790-like [Pistacia vera]|uniref:MATH domain and coiled-coil domain-containing protein At2g01790-like n=1 Tax=Pistacia vera TaxID=55513 RepID=UPI0012639E93|nr:MATH domain and coiled-coil domain-containing protein At2g01790-like [Pistacia vera]
MNQPVKDPPSSRFTWRIENFSRLNTEKHYSEIFIVGGYKWRVLIFPKGNNVDHLSMYLDVADSGSLPNGWSRYAQFSLAVINQIRTQSSVRKDLGMYIVDGNCFSSLPLPNSLTLCVTIFSLPLIGHDTQHQFDALESEWGFTSFMPLGELYDPNRGYLVNDTLIVEAKFIFHRAVDNSETANSAENQQVEDSETAKAAEATKSRIEVIMSNLSAEVALFSSKLAEAEAKLKSYESSEVDHNSRVESLEAELIKNQAENEALKNQAIASEQKASSSEQKALFLEAELIRNEAENEVLKNQAIASEQKASSSEQKALLLARKILKRDKYSKDLSDAASKLIEDSSGSGESKDQGADPLPFPSSS